MTIASYDAHTLFEAVGRLWCRLTHTRINRPINGWYECQECFRKWRAW